jgi:hypothetical protein
LYRHHVDVFHAHGRVLVSVGEEQSEQGCELGADDCADPEISDRESSDRESPDRESSDGESDSPQTAVRGTSRAATVIGPGQP